MRCTSCGYENNGQQFIEDYYYDLIEGDELPIFVCPNCGEDNEERFED